jgi:hypothetical protein
MCHWSFPLLFIGRRSRVAVNKSCSARLDKRPLSFILAVLVVLPSKQLVVG